MKAYFSKTVSMILVLSVTTWSITGCAEEIKQVKNVNAENVDQSAKEEKAMEALLNGKIAPATDGDKQETVYVEMDADGNIEKTIVSDLLQSKGEGNIEDYSELEDIENLSGDEAYQKTSDGKLIWENQGKNISYQGTTTKTPPVNVKIQYYLDGKEMTAKEIAGKSGKVKIVYTYENNETEDYVPFLVLTGMMLDDNFSDVRVKNGKVIAQEGKNIVLGYGVPGLKSYLKDNVEKADEYLENISLPDTVTVSADVKNFSMNMTLTVATSQLGDLDLKKTLSFSDVTDKMDELQEGADSLVDGAEQVQDGTGTLKDGTGDLAKGAGSLRDGIKSLVSGALQIKEGTGKLDQNAGTLQKAVAKLKKGTKTLKNGTASLAKGTKDAKDGAATLAKGADALKTGSGDLAKGAESLQLGTVDLHEGTTKLLENYNLFHQSVTSGASKVHNGSEQLYGGSDDLVAGAKSASDGSKQLTAGLKQIQAAFDDTEEAKGLTNGSKDLYTGIVSANQGVNQVVNKMDAMPSSIDAQIITILSQVSTATDGAIGTETMLNGTVEGINQSVAAGTPLENVLEANGLTVKSYYTLLQAYYSVKALNSVKTQMETELNNSAEDVQALLQGLNALESGSKKLKDGVETLDAGVDQVYAGAKALSDEEKGLPALYQGTLTLQGGLKSLNDGAEALDTGLSENSAKLQDGIANLDAGAGKIETGATSLSEGAKKVKKGLAELSGGAGKLKGGLVKLDNGTGKLKDGTITLFDGTKKLKTGADAFAQGTGKLYDGTESLYDGSLQVRDGSVKLADGAEQLDTGVGTLLDGTKKLRNGAVKLNKKGIKKITKIFKEDAPAAVETIDDILNRGKEYRSFSGIEEGMSGSVKFIFKTEEIE